MPLIYVNYPAGTFTQEAIDGLAEQLMQDGIDIEKLAKTDFVKSTNWSYFQEYPSSHVYHGGKSAGTNVITFEVNVIEHGFDAAQKKEFIKRITDAVAKYAELKDGQVRPVYVLIRDVPETNWGAFGSPIELRALRNPPPDAQPI